MLALGGRFVEVLTDPLLHLGVALVRRVGESIQDRGAAPRADDGLGWTTSAGVDWTRLREIGRRLGAALDLDCILPAVAQVVNAQIVEALDCRTAGSAAWPS